MPNAKRPSGPGRPAVERRDAAHEREELEDARHPGTRPPPTPNAIPPAARAPPSVMHTPRTTTTRAAAPAAA